MYIYIYVYTYIVYIYIYICMITHIYMCIYGLRDPQRARPSHRRPVVRLGPVPPEAGVVLNTCMCIYVYVCIYV